MIWGSYKATAQKDAMRKVVDWDRIKDTVKNVQEGGVSEEDKWYDGLQGNLPYDKLKSLHVQYLRSSRQGKWAKRWWDDEVSAQCKTVQRVGREGVGPGERERGRERE